ncbi:MAG: hypothetical protein Kow00120_02810 [Anaerolineae bacterium]
MAFRTQAGLPVPAVTAAQMREVDRIAVEDFGLGVLQMMENAGRNLARHVMDMVGGGEIVVMAGPGGNGGGGLCCARHLRNRGYEVRLLLSRNADALQGAARHQLTPLLKTGLTPTTPVLAREALERAAVVVDALVGYSLRGAPRGRVAELIEMCNAHARRVIALDVPSGLDATTGDASGVAIRADRTLTLALPKTGLRGAPGALYVADIGIPPEAYRPLGLVFAPFFGRAYSVRLWVDDAT